MTRPSTRASAGLLAILAALLWATPAWSHFTNKDLRRNFVLQKADGALVLYVRTPAPFVFADQIATMLAGRKGMSTPFTRFHRGREGTGYRLSRDAIAADLPGFHGRLERAFALRQHDQAVALKVIDFRLFAHADDTPFGSPDAARASLARPGVAKDPMLKGAVIEIAYGLDPITQDGALTLASGLPAFEMGAEVTLENQVVDARKEGSQPLSVSGQMTDPVRLDGSRLSAFLSFVWLGVLHILDGLDHVLFVLCLAIGVTAFRRLLWMITGFSVGHSVTLIGGFLGYTPTAAWFVPAVEALIAASIIYAAWAAYRADGASTLATALFGLLHGFGFSFVLGEILGRGADGLIASLLAFNLGVEVGQVVIIVSALGLLWLLHRVRAAWVTPIRNATLLGCTLMASYWLVERTAALL